MVASEKNQVKCVQILLSHPDVNTEAAMVMNGLSSVHLAALGDHHQALEMLLAHGAHPDARAAEDGSTALHMVTKRGHVQSLQILLRWKANPTLQVHSGDTPLHKAAAENRYTGSR
jgi:ankyrin repeat protein